MLQESHNSPAFQPDNNRDFQTDPFSTDIDAIYRSQNDTSNDQIFRPELVTNLDSRKLYAIANNIKTARNYKLDSILLTHADRQDSFIGDVAKLLFGKGFQTSRLEPLTEGALRAKESALGATIFGPMRPNELAREFFYDTRINDRDSWFFHQVMTAPTGAAHEVTLHYEVHPTGILRISSSPNVKNEFIHGKELKDFMTAAEMYQELVTSKLYAEASINSDRLAA